MIANRTDAEEVRTYIESRSPWPPQVLTDAHLALSTALEEAIAEYARLGLSLEEISEVIAESVFQAWDAFPEEDEG